MQETSFLGTVRLLALAIGLGGFVVVAIASIAYPWDLGLYEGVIFQPALRAASGLPLFGSEAALTPPYTFPLYGPLYYFGLGAVLRVTGVSFWPGRLLSALCGIGLAGLIYRFAQRAGLDSAMSSLLASVFLMVPGAWTYFTLQRVDGPALFLAALATTIALEDPGRGRVIMAGVLFGAAALTKPAICGLFLGVFLTLAAGRFKRAALLALSASGTVFGVVEGLRALGYGDYLFNLFAALDGDTSFQNTKVLLRAVGGSAIFFVLVTFGVLEASFQVVQKRPVAARPAVLLTLSTLTIGSLLAAHTGSALNYMLECYLALTLLAANSLADGFLSQSRESRLAPLILSAAFLWESLISHGGFIRGRVVLPWARAPYFAAAVEQLKALPRGAVVVGDFPDLALRANLHPWVNDLPQYSVGPAYLGENARGRDAEPAGAGDHHLRGLPSARLRGGSGRRRPRPGRRPIPCPPQRTRNDGSLSREE